MPKLETLKKYAKLVVEVGANVQKDQLVAVNASTGSKELARLITEAAYAAGAKRVVVNWSDEYVSRMGYDAMSLKFGMNGLNNSNPAWKTNQWGGDSHSKDLPLVQ